LGLFTVVVGILGGIWAVVTQLNQTQIQNEQLQLQNQLRADALRQADQKAFDDLLRSATDNSISAVQRIPLISTLQRFWKPDYELSLAYALGSIIAYADDRSIMEVSADVIGHAYEKSSPESDQYRLRSLLYGDAHGKIGVLMEVKELLEIRHDTEMKDSKGRTIYTPVLMYDPRFNLSQFYFREAIRNNSENLRDANFKGAYLPHIYLTEANAQDADFEGANLTDAILSESHFERANLSKAELSGSKLIGAHFNSAHLEEANFQSFDNQPANLENADLTGAYLHGAKLGNADLKGAKFQNADVSDADFEGAIVSKSELRKSSGKYNGNPKLILP
jgi:hypothetical protein